LRIERLLVHVFGFVLDEESSKDEVEQYEGLRFFHFVVNRVYVHHNVLKPLQFWHRMSTYSQCPRERAQYTSLEAYTLSAPLIILQRHILGAHDIKQKQ